MAVRPLEIAIQCVGTPPAESGSSCWIQKVWSLTPERRTGWVIAQILDEFEAENRIAALLQKETFEARMARAGLQEFSDASRAPRKRCLSPRAAGQDVAALLDESGQRNMLAAIKFSLKFYASGIRSWAAFMDALGCPVYFPATETAVIRYSSIFGRSGTLTTYLQHLRWAHRFMRMPNEWSTDAVDQVVRGIKKSSGPARHRLALQAREVRAMVREAVVRGDTEMAALLALGRAFLFRMPSECIPLELSGDHLEVTLEGDVVKILLTRRK